MRACTAAGTRVIVGTGSNNTDATIRATAALAETPGVVGALVVVPYYVRPSIEGIVAHFKAVAAASPVPVIVVQHPGAHRSRSRCGRVCSSWRECRTSPA